MSLSLRYAARTDVGLARDGNEDALYAGPRLLAVADGMGGHAAGEVASRVVIEAIAPLDARPPDGDVEAALQRAVEVANGYLRDMVAADRALEGMGTTLTALLWTGEHLALVHIGDSRAYLLRGSELQQITHDHTFVQTLIDEGRITPEEANTHPQRSWITNALDGRNDVFVDASVHEVQVGDRYLVCSDGLSTYVSEETLGETLGAGDPQTACDQLIDLALRAGGLDNISCIVAEVVEDEGAGAGPIVGGAAADPSAGRPTPVPERKDSPAARAAAVAPRHRRTSAPPSKAGVDRIPPPRRRSHRLALVFATILILVIAAAAGTYFYTRTQYYVGVVNGTPDTVGIYRGVQGGVLGVKLDELQTRTDLPVSSLPQFERDQVTNGIPKGSRSAAEALVASLRQDACAAAATATKPAPSPTASPHPSPTRTPSHKATSTPRPRPTPSPRPSPPAPAYCQVHA